MAQTLSTKRPNHSRRYFFIFSFFFIFSCLCCPVFAKKQSPIIAVMYFDYDGQMDDLASARKFLADAMGAELTGKGKWRIIAREQLDLLIKEQDFGSNPRFDIKTAVKLGKLACAQYVVVGRYFELMGTLRMHSSLINVETSDVIGGVNAKGRIEDLSEIHEKLISGISSYLRELKPRDVPDASPAIVVKGKKTAVKFIKRGIKKVPKASLSVMKKYHEALEAQEKGDSKTAKDKFNSILTDNPDFELASIKLKEFL